MASLPVHKAPVGTLVKIKTVRFDTPTSKYSEGKSEWTHGKIMKHNTGKRISVLWAGDDEPIDSHASHLDYSNDAAKDKALQQFNKNLTVLFINVFSEMTPDSTDSGGAMFYLKLAMIETNGEPGSASLLEPFRTLTQICKKTSMRDKYTSVDFPEYKYPKSWPDILTKDDWRDWVEGLRKEWDNWIQMEAFSLVNWNDMVEGSILTRLYELFEIKSTGRYKARAVDYAAYFEYKSTKYIGTKLGTRVHAA